MALQTQMLLGSRSHPQARNLLFLVLMESVESLEEGDEDLHGGQTRIQSSGMCIIL